jgi:hypothetical protein
MPSNDLSLLLRRLAQDVQRTVRGRLESAKGAAHVQRLARHDAEHRMALVHRVGVEDPGHDARVGAYVGGRDVLLRADLVDDLRGVSAGHLHQFAARHPLRVADDAALGASEGDPHQGALPGHPHRERLHLVDGDVGVVPDPALRGSARDVVRDAEALERLDLAVVHHDRDRDGHGLLALLEDADEILVDLELACDPAKLMLGDLERVLAEVRGCLDGGHAGRVYDGATGS